MQTCPKCGYALTAFDTTCPRCKDVDQSGPRPPFAAAPTSPAPKHVVPQNIQPPAKPQAKSNLSSTGVSIILVFCGGWFGMKFGSDIGQFFDDRALEVAGYTRATKPNYYYWSMRVGTAGTFSGWIAGAICGYFYHKRNA